MSVVFVNVFVYDVFVQPSGIDHFPSDCGMYWCSVFVTFLFSDL